MAHPAPDPDEPPHSESCATSYRRKATGSAQGEEHKASTEFPHCPNRKCEFYEPSPEWRYSPWGSYDAPSVSKPIPRYRCRTCRRTFTSRTFSATYWLHLTDRFQTIAQLSVAGSGIRQIARTLGITHPTVSRHLTRAARQCLVLHREVLSQAQLTEPACIDGFETFEHSQFFPYHINIAAGHDSWCIYHFNDAPLRRKGSMTPLQKARRQELEARLGRPDPRAIENSVHDLIQEMFPLLRPGRSRQLQVHSDQHPAYVRSIRRLRRHEGAPRIIHVRTPSTDPRTRANHLFAINLADLLLRHGGANHRRETIAYDKRRQSGLERMAVFVVWRNLIKWRRENEPGVTAAIAAGLARHRWQWGEVFARRRFPRRSQLPGSWWDYYWRKVKTAALGDNQTENLARFAF